MDVPIWLANLPAMHPELLWESIIAATAAVLCEGGKEPPYAINLAVEGVLGFGTEECRLLIDPGGVLAQRVVQVRHTYEPSRLIELAAIAVAGLALHHAKEHEIIDVAVHGSGADYLVDQARHHLEIAGRSRRRDLDTAWRERWERLRQRWGSEFYLCVSAFETCTARLAFALPEERRE
jgi:hypothetical protein